MSVTNRGRNQDNNLTAIPVADTPGNRFVNIDGTLAAVDPAPGVSRDATKAGETMAIVTLGTEYVEVGAGGVTKGDKVGPDGTGKAITGGTSGWALETVVAGGFAEILLK